METVTVPKAMWDKWVETMNNTREFVAGLPDATPRKDAMLTEIVMRFHDDYKCG